MSISGALFERKRFSFGNLTHVVFWTKGELFYKNLLKRSVLQLKFRNPQNPDKKRFHNSGKTTSNSRRKNRLNRLLYRLLDAISRGTKEIRAFLEETLLFKTVLV